MENAFDQRIQVIIGTGNVMTAAEIEPFHAMQVLSELLFNHLECTLQRIRVLFAHRMEMQSVNAVQLFRPEIRQRDTHAGVVVTRIVQRHFDLGVLRIDADAAADRFGRTLNPVLEPGPLVE
ncbi:hypothetical protein D3C85_1371960 [compost metagenome]